MSDHNPEFEHALISAIVEQKDIRTVIKNKITSEFFFDTQAKAAFQFLLSWYKNPEYGDTPSWDSFLHSFPNFEQKVLDDSTRALCDKVREKKLYSDMAATIQEIASTTSGDPMKGFEEMRKQVARLSAEHIVDDSSDVRNKVDQIRSNYLEMKNRPDRLKGRPYPWPKLNEATLGCQDGQFVIFYARPKSLKTWLLLKTIQTFHASGARPILFSQELSDEEIAERYVCLATGVDFDRVQRGQLDGREERDFFDNLDAFLEAPPVIVSQLTTMGEDCIMEMTAKIDEYQANVVAVDGLYFLGNDVKEIVSATRGMKRVAKTKKIPVLGTTQRLRPAGKARNGAQSYGSNGDDVYGSDSYLQDCDLLLLVESGPEQKRNREVILSVAAIRNGHHCRFSVNAHLCENLEQKQVLRLSDEDEAEEAMKNLDKSETEESKVHE